jgi:hypothetical protein
MEDKLICSGWHFTFGWLRRPEMDLDGHYAYEDGDGDLYYSLDPRHKHVMYLDCLEDADTGEKYLCVSKIPKIMNAKLRQKKKL